MKKQNLTIVIVATILGFSSLAYRDSQRDSQNKNRKNEIYSFYIQHEMDHPRDAREVTTWLVQNDFDVAGVNWAEGKIEVLTTEEGIQFLQEEGFKGFVDRTRSNRKKPDSRFPNPQTTEKRLRKMAADHPSLTRLERIGTTHQKRPIWALLISTTPKVNHSNKPAILFDGMHHAREIMTPEIVLDIGEEILREYDRSPEMQKLVENLEVWIVPMLNPDGNHRVWTDNSMWRKNAKKGWFMTYGVDLNRNYPYRWNHCGGSSGWKSSQIYRGKRGASEPETQALLRLANRIRPAANISYHSHGEIILYPYGCDQSETSETVLLEQIAQGMAKHLPIDPLPKGKKVPLRGKKKDVEKTHYIPGFGWDLLYPVDGDSVDHMFATFGAIAYCVEVNRQFHPSYSLKEPTLKKHRNAWKYVLKTVDQNLLRLKVVDGSGQPTEAIIRFDSIQHSAGEKPFTTNGNGTFMKVLHPGIYDITVEDFHGGQTRTTFEMKGKPNTVQVMVN